MPSRPVIICFVEKGLGIHQNSGLILVNKHEIIPESIGGIEQALNPCYVYIV